MKITIGTKVKTIKNIGIPISSIGEITRIFCDNSSVYQVVITWDNTSYSKTIYPVLRLYEIIDTLNDEPVCKCSNIWTHDNGNCAWLKWKYK